MEITDKMDEYPLPDDLYDSKDWREGSYSDRVAWLHHMYEAVKRERDALIDSALRSVN